jgi:CHAT domain-containing protein/tetratricopeptide (TPR) repeat protein
MPPNEQAISSFEYGIGMSDSDATGYNKLVPSVQPTSNSMDKIVAGVLTVLADERTNGEFSAAEVLENILRVAHPIEIADRLSAIAAKHFQIGDAETQLRLFELALAIRRKVLGQHPQTAISLSDLADCHFQLNHYEKAKALLEEALAMMVSLGGDHVSDLLRILNGLDRLYLKLGELKSAWKCSERALKIAEGAFGPQSIELAKPLASLVEIYFGLGLLDKCYLSGDRALTILRSALGDNHQEVAKACNRLGIVLAEMGAEARARVLLMQALEVMRANDNKEWIAKILANLAETYLIAGDLGAARPLYEEALATARAIFGASHTSTAIYLALLGNFCARVGEDLRALELYRHALEMMRTVFGETHPEIAMLLIHMSQVHQKPYPDVGRAILFQAFAIMATHEYRPRAFMEAYLFLAKMLKPSSAGILFWKLAINDIECMRTHVARLDAILERTFLRQNAEDFRELGDSLISRGRLPEAQQVLTMIKQRELFHLTRIDARKTKVSMTPIETLWLSRGESLFAKIKGSLKLEDAGCRDDDVSGDARRTLLRQKIEQAGKDLGVWCDDLVAAFVVAEAGSEGSDGMLKLDARPLASSPWQPLTPGIGFLQYLLAPDQRGLGIILTTSSVQREFRVVVAEGEVNQVVYAMREAIQRRSADFLENAQRLYQMLIAPVAEDLRVAGINTLIVSLDGVLGYLPMAALHDGKSYLVERFALVLATTAVAPERQNTRASSRHAVGLGVSRPMAGYPPLLGVREELAAIIRTSDNQSGVLPGIIRLDEAFTADTLRHALAPQNSVIHIASHFVFEVAQEASSYLLLGDGAKLTLAEFGELRFDAVDLMVLSACNTAVGGGRQQGGHQIEGLGALVRHQGADKVIATLWPVADLTTASLMRAFYYNCYEIGLHPAEALRRAQVGLLTDAFIVDRSTVTRSLIDPDEEVPDGEPYPAASHPFYWAPYILMGETPEAAPA